RRIVWRHVVLQNLRAAGRPHALCADDVLHGNRRACERRQGLPRGCQRIHFGRLGVRTFLRKRQVGVQLPVPRSNPPVKLVRQLSRRNLLRRNRPAHRVNRPRFRHPSSPAALATPALILCRERISSGFPFRISCAAPCRRVSVVPHSSFATSQSPLARENTAVPRPALVSKSPRPSGMASPRPRGASRPPAVHPPIPAPSAQPSSYPARSISRCIRGFHQFGRGTS